MGVVYNCDDNGASPIPRALPYAVGFLVLFCGIGIAIKAWRFRGPDPEIKWPDRVGINIIIVSLASIGFYIALMNLLGLPLATFLYITFSIWYLKRAKWLMAMVTGLISGIISYYLFIRLLGLSFPAGFLFEVRRTVWVFPLTISSKGL